MALPASIQLTSCHIVEQTLNQDLLWVWSYPILAHHNRVAYTRKIKILLKGFKNSTSTFHYFHHADKWVYFVVVNKSKEALKSELVVVVLCALDLNPERYERISRLMVNAYLTTNSPKLILQYFVSMLATGQFTTPSEEVFYFNEFDAIDYFKHPRLNGIIEVLGVDVILVYTALLLKRRILVYHHDVASLSEFVLSLPAFVMHRKDIWDYVYPFIENTEKEIEIFQDSAFHIVGCTDGNAINRTILYDVYVNVPAAEVVVAPHARESMTMTKTHKDIALFMVQLTEKKGFTERDIMQEINRKTKELIENLRNFGDIVNGKLTLSLDELRKKEFSTTLETFLISLAEAEDILVTQSVGHVSQRLPIT